MTKPRTHFTCLGCKKIFLRPAKKTYYCTEECRFFSRVEKTEYCWNWTGSKHKFGYGEFRIGRTLFRCHRYSYEIHKGEIPEGLGINHTCDNPSCVNPDHLYAGTAQQNVTDALNRERHTNRILTKDQVIQIRSLLKDPSLNPNKISKLFNVLPITIYNIRDRKTWKHLPV